MPPGIRAISTLKREVIKVIILRINNHSYLQNTKLRNNSDAAPNFRTLCSLDAKG